jgi:hypothetical protein
MDLDDLKATWQQETQHYLQSNKKDMEQLQLILKERTNDVMSGVRKKYNAIILLAVIWTLGNNLLAPLLDYWLKGGVGVIFSEKKLLRFAVDALLCLLVVCFYRLKYAHLKNDVSADNLYVTLNTNIQYLKNSLKQEIYFIAGICFLFLIISVTLGAYEGKLPHTTGTVIIAIWAILILFGMALWLILKRKRYYKRNIAQLKHYLAELA